MAEEKSFENRLKRWLESVGVYPLGCPRQKMAVPAQGYYNKRWGGGQFTKAGLPDMQIVVNGFCIEVELKATHGRPSVIQSHIIEQINNSGGCGHIIYPKDFEVLKNLVKEHLK